MVSEGIARGDNNTDNSVKSMINLLSKVCNVGMTRGQSYKNKPSVYWWNNELREFRKKCISLKAEFEKKLEKY